MYISNVSVSTKNTTLIDINKVISADQDVAEIINECCC